MAKKDVYTGQYFSNVVQIRRNMTGLTGSGELIAEFTPPKRDDGDEIAEEICIEFHDKIKTVVDTLNDLSTNHKK